MLFTSSPKEAKCDSPDKRPKGERDYQAALGILSRDRSGASSIGQRPIKQWVEPYLKEETLGFLLLQRQRRLTEIQKQLTEQQYDRKKDDDWLECETVLSKTVDDVVDFDDLSAKVNEELKRLRGDYWEHQIRINKLITSRPYKIVVRESWTGTFCQLTSLMETGKSWGSLDTAPLSVPAGLSFGGVIALTRAFPQRPFRKDLLVSLSCS